MGWIDNVSTTHGFLQVKGRKRCAYLYIQTIYDDLLLPSTCQEFNPDLHHEEKQSLNSDIELRESVSALLRFGMNMVTFIQRSTVALPFFSFAPLQVLTSTATLLFSSY